MKLTCFRNVFTCFRKDVTHLRLRKHVFPSTEIWRKRKKKWYDSAENAATETRVNVVSANGNMSLPSCFRNGFTGLRMFPLTDSWNFVVHGTGSNPKYSETVQNMCKVWENRRCYRSIPSLFTMPCQLVLFKIVQQEHWGDHKILCEAVREMETLSQSSTKGEEEFKMSFPAHLTPR